MNPPPTDTRREHLHFNRLFAGVPAALTVEICAGLEITHHDTGSIVFKEGDTGDCLHLVCDGSVRISKLGRGGQQETLGFIAAGDFFGEMALIDDQPRSAQATAAAPAVLARVDREKLAQILTRAPGSVHMNLLRSIADRLRGIDSHFIAELMRAERLSTVGTMANSIIHDLKNPIQIIRSCIELIERRNADTAITNFTRMMDKALHGMLDMIQELLDFARGQSTLDPRRARASEVVELLAEYLVRIIPDGIHLNRDTECDASVLVDVSRFARVLLNLVKNAIEAMPGGGVLTFRVAEEHNAVLFIVADTGCGIPPELLPRIFEPFVTQGKSRGTGLGLAIVKSVVEAHCGTITVQSQPGEGTTFTIQLPIALA